MITLTIKSEGNEPESYEVNEMEVMVGRDPNSDICLDDTDVSREHCIIKRTDELMVVTDLKSQNGTFLNGKRILQARLADSDEIGIGKYHITFSDSQTADMHANIPDEYRVIFYPETKEEKEKKNWKITIGEGNPQDAFEGDREDILIGKGKNCDIVLKGGGVSWNHALIIEQGGVITVINVSENKDLYINSLSADKRTILSTGFFLKIGENNLTVFPEKQ